MGEEEPLIIRKVQRRECDKNQRTIRRFRRLRKGYRELGKEYGAEWVPSQEPGGTKNDLWWYKSPVETRVPTFVLPTTECLNTEYRTENEFQIRV